MIIITIAAICSKTGDDAQKSTGCHVRSSARRGHSNNALFGDRKLMNDLISITDVGP